MLMRSDRCETRALLLRMRSDILSIRMLRCAHKHTQTDMRKRSGTTWGDPGLSCWTCYRIGGAQEATLGETAPVRSNRGDRLRRHRLDDNDEQM